MPYDVRKRGEQYCVIKRDDGENMGCHDSKKKAEDQRKAILANEAAVWNTVEQALADWPTTQGRADGHG